MGQLLGKLPLFNTLFVTASGFFVVLGWVYIQRGNRILHMRSMLTAAVLQALFLISYVFRIMLQGTTRFEGPGGARVIYLVILVSHSVLAVVSIPLILVALNRARLGHFEAHRRVARIAFPIWVYVSITGPAIYLMLRVLY